MEELTLGWHQPYIGGENPSTFPVVIVEIIADHTEWLIVVTNTGFTTHVKKKNIVILG